MTGPVARAAAAPFSQMSDEALASAMVEADENGDSPDEQARRREEVFRYAEDKFRESAREAADVEQDDLDPLTEAVANEITESDDELFKV